MLGDVKRRVDKRPTSNLEAYDSYLRGWYYFSQVTETGADKAIESFRRAITLDPNFAEAYQGLGCAYEEDIDGSLPPREAAPRARAALQKSLALDETLSNTHSCLGYLEWFYDWNWASAANEMQRAISLDPSDAGTHHAYGDLLQSLGRYDEALKEKERMRELDPLWVESTVEVADVYAASRQYNRAVELYDQAIAIAPDFYRGYLGRGTVSADLGNFDAAVPDFEKALKLANYPETEGYMGFIYGAAGKRDAALAILSHLKQLSNQRYVSAASFSAVYFGLKDNDEAFRWMEKAFDDRSPWLVELKSPIWDPVRSDPRFQAIYKKVGLPP